MSILPAKAWQTALEDKIFRLKITISVVLLLLCACAAPFIFQFIQQREGRTLYDHLLIVLPVFDLSNTIFILLYLSIFSAIVTLLFKPQQFLVALQAYVIVTLFRYVTMLLVPLNPPSGILELHDPFVEFFFYQQSVTKDLFFSGHTSLMLLLALSVPSKRLRYALFIGAVLIAFMLLVQHAHYTIDILAAPLFSWLAVSLAKKLH